MTSQQTLARVTGLVYLLMAFTSAFGLKAMEAFEAGDVSAIIARIHAGRSIYELSIVSSAAGAVCYLILALLLHRLFRSVSEIGASLLLIFVSVSVALWMVAIAKQLDILALLDGYKFGTTHRASADLGAALFSGDQLQVQVTLALYAYDSLLLATIFFWGLWLVPFGWMFYRAGGIIPTILAVLYAIGGVGYMMGFFRPVLFHDLNNPLYRQITGIVLGIPAVACEVGGMLYLLIMGAPGRTRTIAA